MTVQETIELAKKNKLKNSNIVNDTEAILAALNLGLLELYKRFPLRIDEAIVRLRAAKTEYKVDGTDADVSMPTGSQFMWIVAAYQEVKDIVDETKVLTAQIPVNEEENPLSIQTVAWNAVQIPTVSDGAYVSLIYAAAPVLIHIDELDTVLPLPPQMIDPLLEYICYQANGMLDAEIDTDKYYQRFEASCNRIELRGMLTSDDLDMVDRKMKGFC